MNKINHGGPAFPFPDSASPIDHPGMTLRDYFAAKAMQGMLANPKLEKQIIQQGQSWIEKTAWIVADAMIKTRSERND